MRNIIIFCRATKVRYFRGVEMEGNPNNNNNKNRNNDNKSSLKIRSGSKKSFIYHVTEYVLLMCLQIVHIEIIIKILPRLVLYICLILLYIMPVQSYIRIKSINCLPAAFGRRYTSRIGISKKI